MLTWTPYVFVRLTLYLIAGILFAIHGKVSLPVYHQLLYGFIAVMTVYWLLYGFVKIYRKAQSPAGVFGLLALLSVTLFGFLLTYQRTACNQADHIMHDSNDLQYYSGTIISQVQEKAKTYKAEVEVDQIYAQGKWKKSSGTVLVYLDKTTLVPAYGSQLLIKGSPQLVAAPLNPGEFDYRNYLRYQQIYHQHIVKGAHYILYGKAIPNPLLAWSIQLRQDADRIFKSSITSQNEYAIASGLILGIRDGLDNQIKQAYASAGAMHVLAVSGAHVAIVFQFLVLLLGKLKNLKYGNWAFALIVLSILWLYAFVTGLSASVLRAVVMFSFVVIAQASRRQTNIYNTLAVSAFALLCYDPFLIMDVGFQLSYVAVLGIIYLFPKLYRLVDFNSVLANKAWAVTCISIAAMIATVPISLFYFHQFPTYFLLSNLPVIVFSTIVLYLGLAVLLFFWIPYLSAILAFLLQWTIWLLNQSVFLTESLPGALIRGISVSLTETFLLYALIICILLFISYKKLFIWRIVFTIAGVLTVLQAAEIISQHRQNQLAIYALNNHSTLSITKGKQHTFFTTPALLKDHSAIHFHLANHWAEQGISESKFLNIRQTHSPDIALHQMNGYDVLIWQGKTVVFLHQPLSGASASFQYIKADYLVVQNNAVRNLELLQGQFKHLIIDSSNKKYLAKALKQQANALKISCHSVYEDGAFILNE